MKIMAIGGGGPVGSRLGAGGQEAVQPRVLRGGGTPLAVPDAQPAETRFRDWLAQQLATV
jgi:hypothetical protein